VGSAAGLEKQQGGASPEHGQSQKRRTSRASQCLTAGTEGRDRQVLPPQPRAPINQPWMDVKDHKGCPNQAVTTGGVTPGSSALLIHTKQVLFRSGFIK
jgi:hypothetical protein